MQPRTTTASRSKSVTVIGALGVCSGLLTLTGAGMLFGTGGIFRIGYLLGGVAAIVASIGLIRRKEWARRSFIGVQALAIAGALYRHFILIPRIMRQVDPDAAGQGFSFWLPTYTVVFILINVLIIVKLSSRRVREEFDAE